MRKNTQKSKILKSIQELFKFKDGKIISVVGLENDTFKLTYEPKKKGGKN